MAQRSAPSLKCCKLPIGRTMSGSTFCAPFPHRCPKNAWLNWMPLSISVESGNSEILHQWLLMAIRNDYALAYPKLEEFLVSVGRRKFLKPLYSELVKTEAGRLRAMTIYRKARPGYHPIAVATLDEILTWSDK